MSTLTENAIQILEDRYFLKDKHGHIVEDSIELFKRVAKSVSLCENEKSEFYEKQFYELLSGLYFLPNSPTLMNAGCKDGQLSACFVLPVEDSLESIFTTLKNTALIHQSGGGTGFNFSKLRPKDDMVSSTSGTSSGPVAFMKIYDAATEYVKQGGKRRGANMGILNVDHPDIIEFIHSKSTKKVIENFNISVGISDAFMEAVINDSDWQLINPRTKGVDTVLRAKSLWEMIITQAWETGDPGLIFLDTINDHNQTPEIGTISSTNPCGEVPLLDYESCNLGSINLSKMVVLKNELYTVDWKKLSETIHLAIRFLDNIIMINHYLLPEIKDITTSNRKIGLGVMGWAELLILLEIPYASEKALSLGEKLMQFIKRESYKASSNLALEKGCFPNWKKSIHYPDQKMRNTTCNSIAPTGTISVIGNTSYSIEPLFALAYKRIGILGGKTQTEVNRHFVNKMKTLGLWSSEVEEEIVKTGSIKNIKYIPASLKELFQTSLEIPWQYHLKHQKVFQESTDNAVSKTINLPENASIQEVSEIFILAWQYKLKGITIYRYGSKENQVLQKCSLNNSVNC
ncbi:adenosylcobalamin-dependent ribonucleoside-diphosphate reductase [Gelidibacter japonicus]|uniref:adenosylcobalamin-dependent ribonucleoside-diphosphate reductase n=1 Tax=Gelidibacter japonicus TaxID=1962232 RepID=UPI0020228568|nr:adenosylcobalamin-dependent ribonucleoside-diphosphate reductase [Gelidibacter japonicus]MCL8007282.1 adenosylcobalamin-dependent ribonucleoside-diphosphate reductase [Gelidibacter japonicus]